MFLQSRCSDLLERSLVNGLASEQDKSLARGSSVRRHVEARLTNPAAVSPYEFMRRFTEGMDHFFWLGGSQGTRNTGTNVASCMEEGRIGDLQ